MAGFGFAVPTVPGKAPTPSKGAGRHIRALDLHISQDSDRGDICGILVAYVSGEGADVICDFAATSGHTLFAVRLNYAEMAGALGVPTEFPEGTTEFIIYRRDNALGVPAGINLDISPPQWRAVVPQRFRHDHSVGPVVINNDFPIFSYKTLALVMQTREIYGDENTTMMPRQWNGQELATLWNIEGVQVSKYTMLVMPVRRHAVILGG